MRMKVGERVIKGTIKKREEAKEIYDNAKAHGQVAALLDQERPNIFTQSVANILPGNQIEVTLQYVDLLPYEAGRYTFAFPTVVGPRFMPGNTSWQDRNRATAGYNCCAGRIQNQLLLLQLVESAPDMIFQLT